MTLSELLRGESSNIECKQEVPKSSEKYLKTIIGGSFRVVLFRNQKATPQAAIELLLTYCSIPRTREEMMGFLQLNDRKSFKKTYIEPLLASGRLSMTVPDKPRSPLQKYVATGK